MFELRVDCRTCGDLIIKTGDITLHKAADQEGYFYSLTCSNCGNSDFVRVDDFLATLLGGANMSVVSLRVQDDQSAIDAKDDEQTPRVKSSEWNVGGLKNVH